MWEDRKKIFFVVALLAILSLHGCGGGSGDGGGQVQAPAKVSISPASGAISSGDPFTRTVEVRDVGDTFYIAFDLTYDRNRIEYVGAKEGPFLSQIVGETSFQAALENGVPGRITIGITRSGQSSEISGTGTLLTLSFKAVGSGTTLLAFSNPKGFKNMDNEDVAIEDWENATVTVQ